MRPYRILFDRARCCTYLSGLALLLAAITIVLLPAKAVAADPPTQPLDLIYRTEKPEKYVTSLEGLGMAGMTEGTLPSVYLGETGIVKAYLVWAGLGTDPNGVLFARDSELPIPISTSPALTWNNTNNNPTGQNTWNCCGNELSVYAAEITDLGIVSTGTHDYTISGMGIQHGGADGNWGFSLIAVYEDPTLEAARDIVIKLGNDGFHYRWGNLVGPNSDVQCIAVDPSTAERRASFDTVIGGIEDNFRPNGLWGLTGDQDFVDLNVEGGTWNQTVGLINLPANPPGSPQFNGIGVEIDGPLDGDRTGNGIDWPFSDERGLEWDEYALENILLGPGREWVCVQIESANRPQLPPTPVPGFPNNNRGASIGFLGFVAVIEGTTTSAIEVAAAPTYDWTYTVTNPNKELTGQPDLQDVRLVAGPYVTVACPQTTLVVGASMTCTAESTDLAYYGSVAWAIGVPVGGGAAVIDIVFPDPR